MIIHSIRLTNVHLYKDTILTFDLDPLTIIRGINNNTRSATDSSNGSGKSLLVSALIEVLFGTHPGANENKRSSSSGILQNGASITLTVTKENCRYRLKKSKDNNSVKIVIKKYDPSIKKWIDLSIRRLADARTYIDNLIGITEEAFFTLVYLDSVRPSVLRVGTPSQRFNFLSKLFRLEQYDAIKGYIGDLLSTVKDKKTKLSMLIGESEVLESYILPESKLKLYSQNILKIEARIKILNKEVGYYNDKISMFEQLSSLTATKKNIEKLLADSLISDQIDTNDWTKDKLLGLIDTNLKLLSDRLSKLIAFGKNETLKRSISSEIKHIETSGLRHLEVAESISGKDLNTITFSEFKTIIDTKYSDYKERYRAIDRIKDLKNSIDELSERAATLPKLKPIYNPNRKAVILDRLNLITKSTSVDSSGVCNVCGAELSEDFIDELKVLLKHELEELQRKEIEYNGWSKRKDLLLNKKKLLEELSSAELALKKYTKVLSLDVINFFDKKIIDISLLYSAYQNNLNLKQLKLRLANLKKLERPKDNIDELDELKSKLFGCREVLILWDEGFYFELKNSIKQKESIDTDAIKRIVSNKSAKISELYKRLMQLNAKITESQNYSQRFNKYSVEIEELKATTVNYDILNRLYAAFSKKGLKSIALEALSTFIEINMNNYSKLLFREDFVFSFAVETEGVHINVTRKDPNSKDVIESDVRYLSGAESRAFVLLMQLSITPIIQSKDRSNLLILDEFEANLDEEGRQILISNFLPTMNSIVPNIVFVTPYQDTWHQDARILYVEKTGNRSVVTEVSP